jgi:hypothetical protein
LTKGHKDVEVDVMSEVEVVDLTDAVVDAADSAVEDGALSIDAAEVEGLETEVVTVAERRVETVPVAALVWAELAFEVASAFAPASAALVLVLPPQAYIASAVPRENAAIARWGRASWVVSIVVRSPSRASRTRGASGVGALPR